MSTPPIYRRRITTAAFAAVALGLTGLFAAITVAPIAAQEITGAAATSGLPTAASVAGTAFAAAILSRVMAKRGRRPGLTLGYVTAATGALAAVGAGAAASFPLLVAGMLLVGAGNSASLLARYAVADVHPAERRTSVVGLVVWAGTLGAVGGPTLVAPAAGLAARLGLPELTGGYVVACVAFLLAGLVCTTMLRPDPASAGTPTQVQAPVAGVASSMWRQPHVQVALAAMVAGQFVMVLIMTMTPLHLRVSGHGLGIVGTVMSAHVLGMYAFTPIAGRLADRLGAVPVIFAGLGLLVLAAVGGALSPAHHGLAVGASLLARGDDYAARARLQGTADTFVFASATLASLSSGFLVATVGFTTLCVLGAMVVLIPATVVLRRRGMVVPATAGL